MDTANLNLPLPPAMQPYEGLIVGSALAIAIFILGWIASKWANRLVLGVLRNRNLDEALARFLGQLAQYTVLAMAIIAALEKVGVQTTSVVAIFASAGIAVGLALQGNLGHLASGVMILFFRPFSLGDFVVVGGKTGTVEDIGLFATTLLTPNNERIVVPNGTVTGDAITNYTAPGIRRGQIDVGVAYGTDLKKAMEVLEGAAKRAEKVLEDPAPAVAFISFGASSLDMKILAFSKSEDYLDMLHNVKMAAYEDLNAAGIEIPFSQIVVHQAQA